MMQDMFRIFKENAILPEYEIHYDTTVFEIEDGMARLYLVVDAPPPQLMELVDIKHNILSFALYTTDAVVDFCVRVGHSPWMDAGLKVEPGQSRLSLLESGAGMPMMCMVVDASDGRILQLRLLQLPTGFSNQLVGAFNKLLDTSCSDMAFLYHANQLHRKFTPKDLAQAAEHTCTIVPASLKQKHKRAKRKK